MTNSTRDQALALGRAIGAPLGGRAVGNKTPPPACHRCGQSMTGRTWHSYLGHLGLHGLADNWFCGDMEMAQRRLCDNGLARQDPVPGNGAWPSYRPVMEKGARDDGA